MKHGRELKMILTNVYYLLFNNKKFQLLIIELEVILYSLLLKFIL